MDSEVTATAITTQALAGISVAASGVASMATFSSPQTIWMIINQLQLLLLIPLTGAYFPQAVIDYITSMGFALFNLDFLPFKDMFSLESVYTYFDFGHNSEYLAEVGIRYTSTFLNHLALLFVIFLIMVAHLVVLLLHKKLNKNEETTKLKRVVSKLFEYLTFAVYIRMLAETFQTLLLSSLTECKAFSSNQFNSVFSLIFAI